MDVEQLLRQVEAEMAFGAAQTKPRRYTAKERFLMIMDYAAEIGKLTKKLASIETHQELCQGIIDRNEDNAELADKASGEWLKLERLRLETLIKKCEYEIKASRIQLEQMDEDEQN